MNNKKQAIEVSVSCGPTNKAGNSLGLSVRASEVRLGSHLFAVRYAISRVMIHLESETCIFPEEDWIHDPVSISDVTVTYEQSDFREAASSDNLGWSAAASPGALNLGSQSSANRSRKTGGAVTSSYSFEHLPILAHGTAAAPSWSITSPHPLRPLLGTLLKSDRFCRAEPKKDNPNIRISFEIPFDAILVRRGDGTFLSGTKFGIIRFLIKKYVCERKYNVASLDIT